MQHLRNLQIVLNLLHSKVFTLGGGLLARAESGKLHANIQLVN